MVHLFLWGWSFAIFYILSELWGGVVLALLFWQFANEITRTRETKRFYPFFGLLGQQVALIGVGFLVQGLAEESWEASLKVMMMGIVIVGIRIIALYLFGVILIVTLAWLGVVKGALTAI